MILGTQLQILQDVSAHDGQWYWYQFLTRLAPIDLEAVQRSVNFLAKAGLIEIRPNLALGEHPRYWITEKGRRELAASQ